MTGKPKDEVVEMVGTDVVLHDHSPAEIDAPITHGEVDTLFRLAKGLAMSGFFKDAKQAEQAFAKLMFGRDLGLSATAAMTDIHIIEGRPEMSANLQAQMVKRAPGYDYSVLTPLEKRNEECEIVFTRDGEEIGRERYTLEDAERAKLAHKDNWKRSPRNMLFARAMSNGVAFHCPEVTRGIRVYAVGEISDQTPSGGYGPEPVQDEDGQAKIARAKELYDGLRGPDFPPARFNKLLHTAWGSHEELDVLIAELEAQAQADEKASEEQAA